MTTDDEQTPPLTRRPVPRCSDCGRVLQPYEIEHGNRDADAYLSFALHRGRCCECFDERMGKPQ